MSRAKPSNSSGSDVIAVPDPPLMLRRWVSWIPTVWKLCSNSPELEVGDEDRQRDRAQVRDAIEGHRDLEAARALDRWISSPANVCRPMGPL